MRPDSVLYSNLAVITFLYALSYALSYSLVISTEALDLMGPKGALSSLFKVRNQHRFFEPKPRILE